MAKRLRLFDKQGNPVVFDIGSASVTIDAEGKSLDVKLSELVAAIAGAVKSVTFNGSTPAIDVNGNVNLGKQMNPDWNESDPSRPSFIANKPDVVNDLQFEQATKVLKKTRNGVVQEVLTLPSRTSQLQNDSGFITEDDLPEGVECDTQMSSTSVKPVQNKVIKAYVDNLIAGLIDGAPAALDTLKELATALGNNSDAIATIVNTLSSKANASEVVKSVTINGNTQQPQDGNVSFTIQAGSDVSLDDVFGKVWYDSANKKIKFYSKDTTFNQGVPAQGAVAIAELNANAFIKDGMVHSVEVKDADVNGETVLCVVITFNTDAEQEDINIPVSEIFDTSLYYTKNETNTALGQKVDTVVLNGNVLSYTKGNQSVNVATFKTINGQSLIGTDSISIPAGTTPHIDAVTGNWFIGDTDTQIPARGPQGNSGVASADDIEVVNNTTDGGYIEETEVDGQTVTKLKVLSAEMGKELAMGILAGKGSFGDAYDLARANATVVFPWMLVDIDGLGNTIKKMIWHVGNGEFVDAIGSVINGVKNGLTINVSAPCYLRVQHSSTYNDADIYPLSQGVNNLGFDDIKGANQTDGKRQYGIEFFSDDEATTVDTSSLIEIDFGGVVLTGGKSTTSGGSNPTVYGTLVGKTNLTTVKRLEFDISAATTDSNVKLCKSCSNLEEIHVSGTIGSGGFYFWFNQCPKLSVCDLKNLNATITENSFSFNLSGVGGSRTFDLRGVDTRNATTFARAFRVQDSISKNITLIIGEHFSNESLTKIAGSQFGYNNNVTTLVILSDTPPMLKSTAITDSEAAGSTPSADWVAAMKRNGSNKPTAIKVPPGCLSTYTTAATANGWDTYASIISEYAEGDY